MTLFYFILCRKVVIVYMDKELLNYTFGSKIFEEAFQKELNKPTSNEENLKQWVAWDKHFEDMLNRY